MTPLSETERFLKSVGKLYDAFSVHKKRQSPPLRTLSEASQKVKECKQILTEYENSVRSIAGYGPQGMVSAACILTYYTKD